MTRILIITSFYILLSTTNSQAQEQGSLKRCQTIHDKIQFYTDKRRKGGSSSTMQNWRKQRNTYNDLYAQYNCKVHRSALK